MNKLEAEHVAVEAEGIGNTGGFDFAGTTEKDQIEAINGGLKMSADKSAASLMQGKVTGFKLAIVALRY